MLLARYRAHSHPETLSGCHFVNDKARRRLLLGRLIQVQSNSIELSPGPSEWLKSCLMKLLIALHLLMTTDKRVIA